MTYQLSLGIIRPESAGGQHDVGHSVVATERGVLRLSSSISADIWTPAERI
ncbi:hypothetical protein [Lysinibacillus xylanilyticus]|uniref:hypothetical protein n=1 Tax=Lysinibacillus xylanilyticus TaxID=582475 RepID=UPI0038146209